MACSSCSIGEFRASRLEAWKTAYRFLNHEDFPWEGEEPITPVDVLLLARFLEGVEVD